MNLYSSSLKELLRLVNEKKISAEEINDYFFKRIATYNDNLNIYLSVNKELDPSEALLKGLGLGVKDNMCSTDLPTTASSKLLEGYMSPYDATVIKKLKDKGGTILGKTNMDAWAHGSSTETSDFGPTKNPYDTTRAPGGSSGGSAAAVAAGLAPASLGTETAGSIRLPASWCGVVGLKPTYGRSSRYGLVAMGSSWDCPGVMTKTVEDAAFLLEIIAGHDKYDATSMDVPVDNYEAVLQEKRTYKIGIVKEYLQDVDADIVNKFNETVELLKKEGHEIHEIDLLDPKYAISVYMISQRAEVSSNLARYDGIRYGKDRTAFEQEAKRRIMLGTYTLSHEYYDSYYKKALKVRNALSEDFKKVFAQVDLLIAPTTPITALPLGEFANYAFFGEKMDVLSEPASAAGIPALSVPIGLDSHGLPIGLQCMGAHFNEATLLNFGYQVEQHIGFDTSAIINRDFPDA